MKSFSAIIISYSFLLQQISLCAEASSQARVLSASSQPGEQNFISYTALYTDKVIIKCPEDLNNISRPSWGRLVHGREIGISQCYDNAFDCSIAGGVVGDSGRHLLGNDDSGLYFCRVTGSHEADYYLNLTVHAPPQLLGSIAKCTSYQLCEQFHRSVDPNTDNSFTVSVEYFGENGTVDWRHEGDPISYTGDVYSRTDFSDGLYHNSNLTVRVFHAGAHSNFSGSYTANVSNAYGWNVTSTLIQPMCGLNPPDETSNDTKTYKAGDTNIRVSCGVEYGNSLPYIAVCYAPNGESMTEVNVTENCLFCDLKSRGKYCNMSSNGEANRHFYSRPDWKVTLKVQRVGICKNLHTTVLEIPEVSMSDNSGKIYCTWSSIPSQMHVYQQFNLNITQPPPTWIKVNWKKLAIGGVAFVSFVLAVVVLLLAGLTSSCRKARRAEATLKRRQERRKPRQSTSPPLPMPAGQTGSDMSDSEVVFKPQRSSNSSQCSAQIVLEEEVQDHSPLLPKGGRFSPSPNYYGAVSHSCHREPEDFTDAPLICTTADEGDWRLPGARTAPKFDV